MPETSSRISASSSTMRMSEGISAYRLWLGLGLGRGGGSRLRGETELHPGAARTRDLFRSIAQLKAPAVLFENSPDDGETQAGALLTGGDIRLKQPRAVLFRQADAIVDDVDNDVVAFALRADDNAAAPELGRRDGADRFGGVLDDVGQRLRDQSPVEPRRHRLWRQFGFEVNIGMSDAQQK